MIYQMPRPALRRTRKICCKLLSYFFDTAGCEYFERLDGDGDEGSRCNENEATIVSNWVDKLVWLFQDLLVTMELRIRLQVQVGIRSSQIAIITP